MSDWIEKLTDHYLISLDKIAALESLLVKFIECRTEEELKTLQAQASDFVKVKILKKIVYEA